MPRVVFDTVVFVRALLNSRSVCGRLVFEHFEQYRLFLAGPIIKEIIEVLGREELIDRFRLREIEYVQALSRLLRSMERAEVVELAEIPAISRDPKDDKFLTTSKAAAAEFLISEDKDLLVLSEYEGTRILTCGAFLATLGA